MSFRRIPAVVLILGALFPGPTDGAEIVDFVRDVKPIFEKHCTRCHGAEKQESGLRLDLSVAILRGGNIGEVVIPREPAKSRLLHIIRGEDTDLGPMPPEGPGLSPRELTVVENWIRAGAPVVVDDGEKTRRSDHWSLQAPVRPSAPQVNGRGWVRNAIDPFVLAKLESSGAEPSPSADRSILIRRVSLDLVGLPPTPDQTAAFVRDRRPDAYERLVNRLLNSPAYGERWGRHWLDLARYADSNGFTRDFGREIWKYRDWVIAAFNQGMAFDQFTIEQFAGDMLPNPTTDQSIATGFHRNTLINEEGGTDPEQFRVDAVADRLATTGVVYLGLTLGCARCHDHKYDPISQSDYYQMFALLNNCDEPQIEVPFRWQVDQGIVAQRDAIRQQIAEKEKQLAKQQTAFTASQLEWESTITPEFRNTLPGPTQAALDIAPADRDDAQKLLVVALFKTTLFARDAFPVVREIAELRADEPKIPSTMILRQRSERRTTYIHRRGNFLDRGRRVEAGTPAALPPISSDQGAPSRLSLARWLVDSANPLTARVIVNRYWQRFFGQGIVGTENDFGAQGSLPTHPKLLDWLAVEFMESGWEVKQMHRLIVTSATYRQASRHRNDLAEMDPANKLLARQSRLRLEAEIIRDSCLTAGGLLARTVGGPSVHPPQPDGVFAFTQDPKPWNTNSDSDRYRRGMYTHFWRSSPYPALAIFDAPDGNVTCTRRVRSNTPLQSLTLANGLQFVECARALAREVTATDGTGDSERIGLAFRLCLAREPRDIERARLLEMVASQRLAFQQDPAAAQELVGDEESVADPIELAAWTATARVLMNLDEFITRE
jgi:hypothetical protein